MNFNPNAVPTFLFSVLLFGAGFFVAGRVNSTAARIVLVAVATLLAIPGLLFVLYYTHLFDNATWFYSLRAFPYSELMASGLGLVAGISQRLFQSQTRGEKAVAPVALLVLLFVPFMKSALDPLDYGQLRHTCDGEVCLQSTQSTCGPTSAATLLKLFGVDASEEGLARECFTYRGGTEIWHVARAFRKRGFSANFLIQSRDRIAPPAPAIAGVVLKGGAGHFVAILSESADFVVIGDPLKGKLVIPRNELTNVYHFTGFFLVIGPGASVGHGRSIVHES